MCSLSEKPCFYAFDVYCSMAQGFLFGLAIGAAGMALWIINNFGGR